MNKPPTLFVLLFVLLLLLLLYVANQARNSNEQERNRLARLHALGSSLKHDFFTAHLLPQGGFGFFAARALAEGEVVCQVPRSRLICASLRHGEGSPLFTLAFKLLQRANTKYVSSLPWHTCARSIFTPQQVADALAGSDYFEENISWTKLDCALFLVQSRVHLVDASKLCLVPWCDMFNRALSSSIDQANVECITDEHKTFTCRTTRAVNNSGAPLLVRYRDQAGSAIEDGREQWGV